MNEFYLIRVEKQVSNKIGFFLPEFLMIGLKNPALCSYKHKSNESKSVARYSFIVNEARDTQHGPTGSLLSPDISILLICF